MDRKKINKRIWKIFIKNMNETIQCFHGDVG